MSSSENPLASVDAMKGLAERLEHCLQISKLNDETHNEAWVLVHSLSDIADSADGYLKLLPRLTDDTLQGNELVQYLIEIVNQLQHLLYHLEEPRFIRQILEPLRAEWEKARTVSS
jgi:hypothetical protein